MSDEVEENIEVNPEELDQIDEILTDVDPGFVNELKSLKTADLDNQSIGLPSQEEVAKKDKWYYRFWHNLDRKKQMWLVLGLFVSLIGLPALLLSFFGVITPDFAITKMPSLEPLADEKIVLNEKLPNKDLMELFLFDQYWFRIPEQVFIIKPVGDVKQTRISLYLELKSSDDFSFFENHYDEVIEVLSRTLKLYSVDSFRGIEGKEEMRKVLLAALNARLTVKIKSIRYKLLVF